MNTRRIMIVTIAVFAIFFVGLCIYELIPRSYIKLSIAPTDVTVNIDGESRNRAMTGDEKIQVSPGKHIVTISKSEFESYSQPVTVKNRETYYLIAALTPLTDAAKALVADEKYQETVSYVGERAATDLQTQLRKDNPILESLPIQDRLYEISQCKSAKYPDDTTKFALCVTTGQLQSDIEPFVAIDLSDAGYKIADYEIIWVVQE